MRKFEEVEEKYKHFPDTPTILPRRGTAGSAGYDLFSKEDHVLQPGAFYVFWTDVKMNVFFDNVGLVVPRSGLGAKHGIVLRNGVGVIDYDYSSESNTQTGGNIGVCLVNNGSEVYPIHAGDRIAQIILTRFYITDDDEHCTADLRKGRTGGFGSTTK